MLLQIAATAVAVAASSPGGDVADVFNTAGPWAQFGAFGLFAYVMWRSIVKVEERFTVLLERLAARDAAVSTQHVELIGMLERVLERTPLHGTPVPPSPYKG